MGDSVRYILLEPGCELPEIGRTSRFKAVVIVDEPVSNDWRNTVSEWLVRSGCLYMMAWGLECSSWDDAVDWCVLEKFQYGRIPPDQDVETTWHTNEELAEVLWFAKYNANHHVPMNWTILVHIAARSREDALLAEYAKV